MHSVHDIISSYSRTPVSDSAANYNCNETNEYHDIYIVHVIYIHYIFYSYI